MRPHENIERAAREARRRLAAAASCLMLVASQLIGCLAPLAAPVTASAATLPDVIHATTEKDAFASSSMPTLTGDIHNLGGTNPVSGQQYLSYATAWRTQEGLMGYCVSTLDNHKTPADGQWLTYRKNRLMDADLAYILRHGYPFENEIGGVRFSDADARLVTQFAFWLITDEDFNADSGSPWKTGTAVPAARRLVADARAHGAEEAKRNRFWVYSTDDGPGYQDLVLGVDSTGGLRIVKKSSDESVSGANPLYDLSGAVFGLYEDEACTKEAARLTTDASGSAEVGGLLSGTYFLQEIEAPSGYARDGQVRRVEVPGGDVAAIEVGDAPQTCEVGVAVQKVDAETKSGEAQGAGSLEGAEFRVDFFAGDYSAESLPAKADSTWTVRTDAAGTARLNERLPLGTVAVTETKAPKGYLLDGRTYIAHITSDGDAPTVRTYLAPTAEDSPIRGDVSFTKADEDSQRRMARVPFLVTSTTTGETHVAVTDDNGRFDSAAFDASAKTNANDDALLEDGSIDPSRLDPEAGVWFGEAGAERARGALPYDVYTLEELRCPANAGHRLISDSFTVSKDSRRIELGTFDDHEVAVATALSYGDGEKACPAADGVELVDEVSFEGLERGKPYRLEGELHLISREGADEGVVARSSAEFTPSLSCGSAQVRFEVDASALGGKRLVAFERLKDGKDVLAEHADPSDEGQTVSVPEIATELAGDAGHEADAASGAVRLTDTVGYRGLEPGVSYELEGELRLKGMGGSDEGPALDETGEPIRARATFTATGAEGTAEVVFEFEAPSLAGRDVVAFESLKRGGVTYAVHADIEDASQTVSLPALGTTADSAATGSHVVPGAGAQTVVDAVEIDGVEAGVGYELKGELHVRGLDGSDEGAVASAELSFIAEGRSCERSLEFEVDVSSLGGRTLVAFERLVRDGGQVASHADIGDEGQSVAVPAIGTTLAGEDGSKELVFEPDGEGRAAVKLEDTVEYVNLVPGLEYRLEGSLVKKATGELLASSSASLEPRCANGYGKVGFELDAGALEGEKVVATEKLYLGDVLVAEHSDMEDEGQTVRVSRRPQEPAGPSEPAAGIPATGDASIPAAAIVILGGLLSFTAWAIVRGGSMTGEDDF